MDLPENRDKVELAKNFTFHLLKGVKQIGMYRHNEAKFPEFLAKAHEAIEQFTAKYGPLSMKVEAQNLTLLNQPLFSEDSNLPYKFYRDGIRQLIFRPDLSIDEMVQFTMIALSEPERGAEDILAQLWKSGMEHVEYVVVEGFKMDEAGVSDEEMEVEVDQIVGYLYQRLKTDSDDYLRFARVTAEDLDNKVDNVDQIRGAVISGDAASDELKALIQKDLQEEESQRLFPKLISAVFQVIEGGVEDAALLEEMFAQLLDAMLLQEDFGSINLMLLKLRAMEQRDKDNETLARLKNGFAYKMGEEQRVVRIGEVLKASRPKNLNDIQRYLQALTTDSVPTLLAVIEGIEIPENKAIVIDLLAKFARELPEPFVNRLDSDKPQTVRDMVAIIEKSNHPDKVKLFQPVLKSPNMAVRLEAMKIVARGRTAECRNLISGLLDDPKEQVRIHAARLLPEFDRDKSTGQALVDLLRIIKDKKFEDRSDNEKAAIFAALGSTNAPGALTFLQSLLTVKPNLLNKKKVLEDKLLAVAGLQGAESIQAYKLLGALVEDKTQPTEVLVAGRKALYTIKKSLFGENAAEG
ncbi:MAG: HEAT repeat domain-containing protein [Myxococcaceae bacterium]